MPQILPGKVDEFSTADYSDTILPDGIKSILRRFAITYRNKCLIKQSNHVVTYITNHIGSGAAQFKEFAEKQAKMIIDLGSEELIKTSIKN